MTTNGGLGLARRCLQVGLYMLLGALAAAMAFLLRFDFQIPEAILPMLMPTVLLAALVKGLIFHLTGIDRERFSVAQIQDLSAVFQVNLGASACLTIAVFAIYGRAFPRSVYLLDLITCSCGMVLLWTLCSAWAERRAARRRCDARPRKRILVYGAGDAGSMLIAEIRHNPHLPYQVVGFLDDDPAKQGTRVHSVPVLGPGREVSMIAATAHRQARPIDEVIVTIPSASGRQMQEVLANCRMAHIPCKTLPGAYELLEKAGLSAQIRDFAIEDLLGRAPVDLESRSIAANIRGKTVLVSGAAGSIGSELCRQIARLQPARLVILDQAESALFYIDNELRAGQSSLEVCTELGSVQDRARLASLFRQHKVDIVCHAAAYKHVPMLEAHPLEGAVNNVIGTWNLLNCSIEANVGRFLMISTDKAVNPTSFMGVTKRACELLVAAHASQNGRGTCCMAVRFGNVLGSNGSVVPLFRDQIARGGPVTVTHPEVKRYFMSVSEAVHLSLQASTIGNGGEIFVLDMGEPVRIADLAEAMIRLSGHVPHDEIAIRFTGLRPGEKLFEEIRLDTEQVVPTCHPRIHVFREEPRTRKEMQEWVAALQTLLDRRLEAPVRAHLKAIVPEYQTPLRKQPALARTPDSSPASSWAGNYGTIQVPLS